MQVTKNISSFVIRLLYVAALVFLVSEASAQEQTRHYNIFYKGDVVGKMQFYQNKTDETLFLKITSATQVKVVLNVNVDTEEEATFEKGKLIYSKLYRTVNGKEKANNITRAKDNRYVTTTGDKEGFINRSRIDYNFVTLFYKEPGHKQKIYSDNFLKVLDVEKIAHNKYKVQLPDGNYNYYYYENGVCVKVEVHHSFYTIEMRLM